MKLWKVSVNNWSWDRRRYFYAKSREEAEKIGSEYLASSAVRFAGNFSDNKAEWLLSDSTESFEVWKENRQSLSTYDLLAK